MDCVRVALVLGASLVRVANAAALVCPLDISAATVTMAASAVCPNALSSCLMYVNPSDSDALDHSNVGIEGISRSMESTGDPWDVVTLMEGDRRGATSHEIVEAFDSKLRDIDAEGSLTHDDLVKLYPSRTISTPIRSSLEELEYYAAFASDPAVVNEELKREREEELKREREEELKPEREEERKRQLEVARTRNLPDGFIVVPEYKHQKKRKHRQFDYQLNDDEKTRLQEHGLMVSERLGANSFGDLYYRLYTDDLPVFVTSDSILHAWHRSFDAFLADLEVQELMPLLGSTLAKMLEACAIVYDGATATANQAAQHVVAEVELYLTTAHRLLTVRENEIVLAPEPPEDANDHPYYREMRQKQRLQQYQIKVAYEDSLGKATTLRVASNAHRLSDLLEIVKEEKFSKAMILGSERAVDFSLFKPRGHYTKSEKLERYFRAMTWLGTIDFRIDGAARDDDETQKQHLFQLQCACMVVHVLRQANTTDQMQKLLDTISALAGDGVGADNMTPMQLSEVIGDRDVLMNFFGEGADAKLRSLQDEIANRKLGTQAINAHPLVEGPVDTPSRPPTAFGILGQQFVWSSFVFSKLVFDQVFQNGEKVPRRIPSGMDVAFALFGNDAAASVISERMTAFPKDDDFTKFRDGLEYASNLLATRQVVDEALAKADPETSSVAMLWQLALRELSQQSANSAATFKSDAWRKRLMNTQLASFTQLRHDTVLYAKQASGIQLMCEYPAGYVDPYPKFWRKMHQLAERTLSIVEMLRLWNAQATNNERDPLRRPSVPWKARSCFEAFVNVTQTLSEIATAQAIKEPLTDDQVKFLKTVMEEEHGSGWSAYKGWYPSLFYTEREESSKRDRLVADVFTDPPSDDHGDPGGILHMGVGDVNLAMVVVDETLYAGPVFSHYEFVTPRDERLTDDEFSARLSTLKAPKWALESFLVGDDRSEDAKAAASQSPYAQRAPLDSSPKY